jgi:hypothetical protein
MKTQDGALRDCIYRIRNHEASGAVSAENLAAIAEIELLEIERVCSELRVGLSILLMSHGCLTKNGEAEIPEEISSQFDINLDDAEIIFAAMKATEPSEIIHIVDPLKPWDPGDFPPPK